MNKDLTIGKPSQVLWKFCLPLFGSIIFQQLYNLADSFVAGKFIGESALAAVGNSYEITLIFIAIGTGCNVGCSIIISQLFGAKKNAEIKTAVYTAFLAMAAICAFLMSVGLIFCNSLLTAINTPANILSDSKVYLDIYIWGLPFVFYYNVSNGIFTALGDSRTPFWFLSLSSISNIGMDIFFVSKLNMGVAGVAWATFICQGISCLLAVFFALRRVHGIHCEEKPALFSWKLLGTIARIAVPSMIQQSFVSVGNIMIQGTINSFGSAVTAGYAAGVKLNNLVISCFSTISNGVSTFTAQNMGAGKPERIREGRKAGFRVVWIICVPFVVLYFLAGRLAVGLFMDDATDTALQVGITYLRILAPFYFVVSAKMTNDGVLRGTAHMKQFMVGTFTDLILRVGLAKLFSLFWGPTGIWLAWPVGWTIATLISLNYYRILLGDKR